MAETRSETIKLFVLGGGWGVPFPTGAPFPLKLATWLRMAELPFELVVENNPGKGPKGKSPWVEIDGVPMADSGLIMEHLSRRHGIDMDGHLDADARAVGTAVQRMLEDHYHQCFEHQLFFGRGYEARKAEFAASLGFPLGLFVPALLVRSLAKQLHARGMGRHSEAVIIAQGKQDLDALSALLGDKPFLLGDRPSSFDACAFGFLGVSVYVSGDNPLFSHGASLDNLMRYTERMRARYFPESLSTLAARDAQPAVAQATSSGADAPAVQRGAA